LALKRQNFAEGEIAIFDEACVYKGGEYWQFRLWLPKENKYARKSLRTRSECYMRTLRFKQANPSVGTLAICASKLQHYASCMTATDAHGKQFIKLS
jgi:hypothetical protein